MPDGPSEAGMQPVYERKSNITLHRDLSGPTQRILLLLPPRLPPFPSPPPSPCSLSTLDSKFLIQQNGLVTGWDRGGWASATSLASLACAYWSPFPVHRCKKTKSTHRKRHILQQRLKSWRVAFMKLSDTPGLFPPFHIPHWLGMRFSATFSRTFACWEG